MNVGHKSNFMASRIQKYLFTSITLIIYNYYGLRQGNQNKFTFAVNCLFKKMKYNFNLLPIF